MTQLQKINLKDFSDIQFSASYAKDAVWEDGLRDFFEYRDLGVSAATHRMAKAHIIRVK